jgi:hypothetical protein
MCVSEPIESMERTESPLALGAVDRDGETRDSLIFQDTMGCDMGGDVRSLSISTRYIYAAQGGDVLLYPAAALTDELDER